MDILKPTAVIGTNSWGGKLYGKTLRGSYVEDEVIKDAMKTAKEKDIALFDLARDYGLGKAEKMIGEFGTEVYPVYTLQTGMCKKVPDEGSEGF